MIHFLNKTAQDEVQFDCIGFGILKQCKYLQHPRFQKISRMKFFRPLVVVTNKMNFNMTLLKFYSQFCFSYGAFTAQRSRK